MLNNEASVDLYIKKQIRILGVPWNKTRIPV